MTGRPDTIWELVRQAAETLPEPFSRHALVSWVSKRRPDVEISSISTHIQYATADTPNRERHNLGSRAPLLERIDRGLYRKYRGATRPAQAAVDVPAKRPAAPPEDPADRGAARIVLVGCTSSKATGPRRAAELFTGAGFAKACDYATAGGGPWYVLSAKYGLLHPDDVVAPYDVYLGDRSSQYRSAWGEWVIAALAERHDLRGAVVEEHAGRTYVEPLVAPLVALRAELRDPLAGLRQGERLAWPGYREPTFSVPSDSQQPPEAPDLEFLLDGGNAVTPADFLAAGPAGRVVPGLYSWWIDRVGAQMLSAGLGSPVAPGLLYAGKAGGHRQKASPSESTLWGRIAGNHLRGNIHGSTFRKSLTALLSAAGEPAGEERLTAWMHDHLRVAVLPVPSELVASLEDELVSRTQPPLNLAGVPKDGARSALSRLRGLLSRPASPPATEPDADEAPTQPTTPSDATSSLERRIRQDLDAIIAAGYRPTVFQRMLSEHGAVETARRLMAAPQISDGFQYLWEHGLLQHSVENAVLDPAFAELFTVREREVARQRLLDAGYR